MNLFKNAPLQGGRYVIESVLGQGGFGVTYLATMRAELKGSLGTMNTNVRVAIKEFFMKDFCERGADGSQVTVPTQGSRGMVEAYRRKFRKEAENLARLDHPNIVHVFDVFDENGTTYYVMEYVDGGSLQQHVAAHGPLPEAEALAYTAQLAGALDYMHGRQMCHFDVKPGNVLMSTDRKRVCLIDFGLSKQYDEEGMQTSSTPVGLSEGYAPMEQYETSGIASFSPATDIYALGATLYFLLTGQRPPKASMVLDEGLPALPPQVSERTAKILEQAMSPRRKDRPQSSKDFLSPFGISLPENGINTEQTKLESSTPLSPFEMQHSENDNVAKRVELECGRPLSSSSTSDVSKNLRGIKRGLRRLFGKTDELHVAYPVDLGLSVKWASWDMGATSPEVNGQVYRWGSPNYRDNSIAATRHDVAHVLWGIGWRIPTYDECVELIEKCTWRRTKLNTIDGVRVYGPNGNSIFFPFRMNYSLYYWTANVCKDSLQAQKLAAWCFYKKYDDGEDNVPHLLKSYINSLLAIRPVYVE